MVCLTKSVAFNFGALMFLVSSAAWSFNYAWLRDAPARNLTADDWTLVSEAAERVLGAEDPGIKKWENPKTKHSGSIEGAAVTVGDDRTKCRLLTFRNHAGNVEMTTRARFCEVAPSDWRIVSE